MKSILLQYLHRLVHVTQMPNKMQMKVKQSIFSEAHKKHLKLRYSCHAKKIYFTNK